MEHVHTNKQTAEVKEKTGKPNEKEVGHAEVQKIIKKHRRRIVVVAALLPEFVSVLFFPFPLSLCNPTPREGKLGASKMWNLMNHIFDRGLRMSGEGGGNGGLGFTARRLGILIGISFYKNLLVFFLCNSSGLFSLCELKRIYLPRNDIPILWREVGCRVSVQMVQCI